MRKRLKPCTSQIVFSFQIQRTRRTMLQDQHIPKRWSLILRTKTPTGRRTLVKVTHDGSLTPSNLAHLVFLYASEPLNSLLKFELNTLLLHSPRLNCLVLWRSLLIDRNDLQNKNQTSCFGGYGSIPTATLCLAMTKDSYSEWLDQHMDTGVAVTEDISLRSPRKYLFWLSNNVYL